MTKILAIDNRRDNLIVLKAIFRNYLPDCTVITALSGPEGLKRAMADSPDVILLDIHMPQMDGFEVCRILREEESTRFIPIIMLTAVRTEAGDHVQGLESGADFYLEKPIEEDVLVAQVRSALRIKAAEDRLREGKGLLEREVEKRTRELSRSEGYNRMLFDLSPVGLALRDMDGNITDVNEAYCRIIGYTTEEAVQLSYWDITPPSYADEEQRQLEQLKKFGANGPYEKEYIHKDGHLVPVRLSGRVISKDGKSYIWSSVEDISDWKEAEKAKSLMESRLRQAYKLEAIGSLAGGIAHDFNNILNAILGFSELALLDLDEGRADRDNLIQVIKAGKRAKELVKRILTFSRQAEQELRPMHLGLAVKEALALLRSTLLSTIELRSNLSEKGHIMADPTLIHQIVMNLATNSVQAMQNQAGQLDILLEEVAVARDSRECRLGLKPGPYLKLVVSDTGAGISPEVQDRIFDPFFTTKEIGEGTGLGLAVVHGLVAELGGAIFVDSQPGQGASFSLYFPAIERIKAPAEKPLDAIPRGRESILFVDDEDYLTVLGKQMLTSLGYSVTTATGSGEALRLFEAEPARFDLVITDRTMPRMNGEELARKIIALRPDIPVILCTGFSSRPDEKVELKKIFRAFLLKPFLRRDMAETIRLVLDGQAAA